MAAGFRSPSPPPPPLLPLLVLVFNCLLLLLPVASRGDDSCPNSESVPCGRVNISYPFWFYNGSNQNCAYCGYQSFMLTCQRNIPILRLGEHNYSVIDIDYTEKVVSLADDDIVDPLPEFCPIPRHNVTWPSDVSLSYAYTYTHYNLTFFFNCSNSDSRWSQNRICPHDRGINYTYVFQRSTNEDVSTLGCSDVVVWPILEPYVRNDLGEYELVLQEGFKLHWTRDIHGSCSDCEKSGGRCGYNTTDDPVCFCSGGKIEVTQCARCKNRTALIIGIVIGALVAVGLLCASILFCRYKKKRNYLTASKTFTSSASSGPSSMDPEKYSVHFQTNLFSYDELQEATNGFDKELGDGGFGTVYKGFEENRYFKLVSTKLIFC